MAAAAVRPAGEALTAAGPADLPDLAAERFGGSVVACSDEFFGAASRLLLAHAPEQRPHTYTEQGQWMDGWETRRHRAPDHDWAVVRLGAAGIIERILIDTAFFTGNYPEQAAVDGAYLPGNPTREQVAAAAWDELVGPTPLRPSDEHVLPVAQGRLVTHVRLRILPDGGVARLRVHGRALPDLRDTDGLSVDLAAGTLGGQVTASSNAHYGYPGNLVAPGDPLNMGDGWETRRRRGPGTDWAVLRLAGEGLVRRLVIDTRHFRGNAPRTGRVEASADGAAWSPLLPETPLQPDQVHAWTVTAAEPARWLRLTIGPDGGVARLRALGVLTATGREELGRRWLDALPQAVAERELLTVCGSTAWAARLSAQLPLADRLEEVAAQVWQDLEAADWEQALAAHPRIGDRPAAGTQESREQSGAAAAPLAVLAGIAEGNRAYEARFRRTYVVRATGRSAEQLLALLERRLGADPAAELRTAAAEQAEITALRLRRLVAGPTC